MIGGGLTSMDSLTVLAVRNDPYRFDHAGGHEDATWFVEVMNRFVPTGEVHLRGLHYRVVASGDVLKPDGQPYENTEKIWQWLLTEASAAARWLEYVPFERIIDERNEPPVLPDYDYAVATGLQLARGYGAIVPYLDDAMPKIGVHLRTRQPYRIILFGEKSSLGATLGNIRRTVNGELLLPTGESTTHTHSSPKRGRQSRQRGRKQSERQTR
jgi:hypothetical protein